MGTYGQISVKLAPWPSIFYWDFFASRNSPSITVWEWLKLGPKVISTKWSWSCRTSSVYSVTEQWFFFTGAVLFLREIWQYLETFLVMVGVGGYYWHLTGRDAVEHSLIHRTAHNKSCLLGDSLVHPCPVIKNSGKLHLVQAGWLMTQTISDWRFGLPHQANNQGAC